MTDIDPGDGSRNVTLDGLGNVLVTTDSGGITKINPNGGIIPFASGLIDPHGTGISTQKVQPRHGWCWESLSSRYWRWANLPSTRADGNRTLFGTAGGNPNFLAFETIFPVKADFNGDGKSDILWQNNSNGARAHLVHGRHEPYWESRSCQPCRHRGRSWARTISMATLTRTFFGKTASPASA